MSAGQKIYIDRDSGLGKIQDISPSDSGSWRRGIFSYANTPFSDVIKDISRYTSEKIVIMDTHLNTLPVTAVFTTKDTSVMLNALEEILPLKLTSINENEWVIYEKNL